MSVRRAMREVSSREFAEWMAFYVLEDEAQDPDRAPSADELGRRMAGWAAAASQPGGPA
jgi:hypothetical protein